MSKSIKVIVALGLAAFVAACAQEAEDEYVVTDPEPISMEPTHTGKYK
jgi:hypothetical protein